MIESDDLIELMSKLKYEPTRIQGLMMDNIDEVFEGGSVMVDPSHPFAHLFEASVVLTCAAIQQDEVLSVREFPVMAKTDEDLYHHMSDVDYEGMFGTGGGAWFDLYFGKEEVLTHAVRVGDTQTKRITLPKHSQILVNNTPFTFQYPINIIVKSHGGLDVVYDTHLSSPLQTLAGNKVDWSTEAINDVTNGQGVVEFVRMRVWLKQMQLTSYTESLNSARIFRKTIPLTDNYYYTRAYAKNSQGTWVEIKTTHSQQVFDPSDPTLLLKVVDEDLLVELPYVYYATDLVSRTIRIDVYTTKGPINMNFAGLTPSSFVATWRDLDEDDAGIYSAPLGVMNSISIISTDTATGGADAPTFQERRERVLTNALGDAVIPISNAQMNTALEELGFDTMMTIDLLTERTYLVTRPMPDNVGGNASTGVDTAVMPMRAAMTDILGYETVLDNGNHITITPKTLYRNIDGVLKIVSDTDRKAIDQLTGEAKANRLNDGTYLYSPLHYVLDLSNNEFKSRPYYLTAPEVELSSFAASNDTLGLTIGSGTIRSIVATDTGYTLQLISSSNEAWKTLRDDQVHVQLGFIAKGESDYSFVMGTQIGKTGTNERIFEFAIETNWDLSSDHYLTVNNFTLYDDEAMTFAAPLAGEFALIWAVSDYEVNGMETSSIDQLMGRWLLPEDAIGAYHEILLVELGTALEGLWSRARSMIGERKYLTYTSNVVARYKSNVYEIDPITGQPKIVEVDGVKQLVIEHQKGDVILNMDGEPVIEHFIGDAVLDEFGNPILESERTVVRWWDLVLFDGVYRYATNVSDKVYALEAPRIMVDWIVDIIQPMEEKALERTDLYFHPRNTLKHVEVLTDDGDITTIQAAQRLTVDYYVSKEVYEDSDLRESLTTTAVAQIVAGLDALVVSRYSLEKAIESKAGVDIVSVEVSGLGGILNDFNVVTLRDESARLCVAKSLMFEADGTYSVVDSIEVNFRRHAER